MEYMKTFKSAGNRSWSGGHKVSGNAHLAPTPKFSEPRSPPQQRSAGSAASRTQYHRVPPSTTEYHRVPPGGLQVSDMPGALPNKARHALSSRSSQRNATQRPPLPPPRAHHCAAAHAARHGCACWLGHPRRSEHCCVRSVVNGLRPSPSVLQLVVSMLSKVMKDYEPGLIEFIESVWQQARSSPP